MEVREGMEGAQRLGRKWYRLIYHIYGGWPPLVYTGGEGWEVAVMPSAASGRRAAAVSGLGGRQI